MIALLTAVSGLIVSVGSYLLNLWQQSRAAIAAALKTMQDAISAHSNDGKLSVEAHDSDQAQVDQLQKQAAEEDVKKEIK